MVHRLFTLVSGLSLVLFLATAALWARSYAEMDRISVRLPPMNRYTQIDCAAGRGEFAIQLLSCGQFAAGAPAPFHVRWMVERPYSLLEKLEPATSRRAFGFAIVRVPASYTNWVMSLWGVAMPCWFILVMMAILPVMWARRLRQIKARRRLNLCLSCGYDLRASTNRCPECGTPIPAARETDRAPADH
jgi:hypothetical protein